MIEILTVLGVVIGLVAGGSQIWQHLHPRRKPEILTLSTVPNVEAAR
jgi:hypothetical protein